MHMRNLIIAAAGVLVLSAVAEAQGIKGKWTAEYPQRVRGGSDGEVVAMGSAILTIDEVRGDSVFGTWQPQNTPNPSEPRRIAGVLTGEKLTFVGAPVQAQVRRGGMGGEGQNITMRTYFEGTLKGDAIDGTMFSKSEDETITSASLKWTAKRSTGS